MTDKQDGRGEQALFARRNVTLVIRAFVNEDGSHYGIVSDPGQSGGWQATFSQVDELMNLVLQRLENVSANGSVNAPDNTSVTVRGAYPDAPGPPDGSANAPAV